MCGLTRGKEKEMDQKTAAYNCRECGQNFMPTPHQARKQEHAKAEGREP